MMREGWEYKKLGDCFYYIKNGANIKQKKDVDGYPITRIETLSGGVFNRDRVGYAGIHDLSKYAEYILESKDLLMSHINSKTYIGRTVEYKSSNKETIIHGMNLLRLKANLNIIDSTFFAYYTQSGDFKSKIARIRKDAVNQSSFAISDLKRFDIPLPPKSTQLAIVSELDKINELIRLKEEQLKDFDNLAQSIFYEMFGDPVENEMGWEVKKLSSLFKVSSSKRIMQEEWTKEGVPFLKVSDIVSLIKYGEVSPSTFISQLKFEKLEKANMVPMVGDILITSRGTLGLCYTIKTGDKFYFQDGMVTWLSENSGDIIPIYITYLFSNNHFLEVLAERANKSTVSYISIKQISQKKITIPPLPLQHLFAHRIEQIEHQKSEVQKAITDLETLLASRMQYWFE